MLLGARPSSNDEDSLRVGGIRAVVVLEFWTCSDERETGVQWRPFPGFYIYILRHDREKVCVPDAWAFGSS